MTTQGTRQQATQRLLHQIQDSLGDTLTPVQARSIMLLKGMTESELAKNSIIDQSILKDWLNGSKPILNSRRLNLLELVLGVENGTLAVDRVHLFDLDETKLSRDNICTMIANVMPIFKGSLRSQVCDSVDTEKWKNGARIFVVQLPAGQHAIIRHVKKSLLGSNPVGSVLEAIRWAAHGKNAADSEYKSRSELIIPAALANDLSCTDLRENDRLCGLLAEQFMSAQQVKKTSSLRAMSQRAAQQR